MFFDMPKLVLAADRLLETTENPHHRAILENYRRHAMLEVCGRWREILTPDMTVAEPVYIVHSKTGAALLDGHAAVAGLYESYYDTDSCTILLEDEVLIVGDWGFSSEAMSHRLWRGKWLREQGEDIDDPEAWYIASNMTGMFWPYSRDAKMMGEHVYRGGKRTIRKAEPHEVIRRDEVNRVLTPLIAPLGTYLNTK